MRPEENTVIRTDSRLDNMVKHLGYQSVSMSLSAHGDIPTDKDLIRDSQERLRKVKVVSDDELSTKERMYLALARTVVDKISYGVPGVHAAIIPPASDRVRTAGLYGKTSKQIFIALEKIQSGRDVVDVTVHEVAHFTSQANDGEPSHYEEISHLAGAVAQFVDKGVFDEYLKRPGFSW